MMVSPNSSFEAASRLEEGDIPSTTRDVGDEKAGLDNSPTLTTSGTFKSQRTFNSTLSSLKRAQTWAVGASAALRPRTNKGKVKVQVPELESHPLGYPRLACFLDSDDSFMVYRRFGILHSRLLLQKQDKLRELENELFTSDKQDEKTEEGQLCMQSREEEEDRDEPPRGCRPKKEILDEIQRNLLEYGEVLKQAQEMTSMNKPHERDHRSVVNFIENHQPLVESEREFVYCREDLVSLRSGRENAWLDAAVEAVLRWYPCKPIKRIFCTEESQRKTMDPDIHYFSRSRINFVVTLIITFIILVLLVAPIVGLFELTQRHDVQTTDAVCIGILLVSTLVFSSVLSMFTKAKRHEILAAAAGYCAVLVVFVGNVGNGGGNSSSSSIN